MALEIVGVFKAIESVLEAIKGLLEAIKAVVGLFKRALAEIIGPATARSARPVPLAL